MINRYKLNVDGPTSEGGTNLTKEYVYDIIYKHVVNYGEYDLNTGFFIKSALLGIGLAMDAFSVSLANGLNEPKMKTRKMCAVSAVFAFFQFLMPILGWMCVHSAAKYFCTFQKLIPWIALILLLFIGGKMLIDGIKSSSKEEEKASVGITSLLLQGIATSIDALSVGFTISDYGYVEALSSCGIIAAVTFVICMAGVLLGKKFGTSLAEKASVLGGIILIAIGIEIFVTGIF